MILLCDLLANVDECRKDGTMTFEDAERDGIGVVLIRYEFRDQRVETEKVVETGEWTFIAAWTAARTLPRVMIYGFWNMDEWWDGYE